MKTLTAAALLALSSIAYAIPAERMPIEKRAVCTAFGFYTYSCAGASTPTTASTKTTAIATSPATSPATTTKATTTSTSAPSTGGASTYTSGDTADDIEDDIGCTALTVIFARGTSESGNIGTIAGPPMFKQLLSDLGASKLTLQGVDYPASAAGNADCGSDGGAEMAQLFTNITARCPNTKAVLSGYSQGACVVHNAVQSQGIDASKIAASVLFGEPHSAFPVSLRNHLAK